MVSARRCLLAPGRRGFTLIELTISVVILAFGLLALVGALTHALRVTTDARLSHAALRAAEAVADSCAFLGAAEGGSRIHPRFRLAWSPESCAAGTCVRIIGRVVSSTDSIVIVTRVGTPAPAATP